MAGLCNARAAASYCRVAEAKEEGGAVSSDGSEGGDSGVVFTASLLKESERRW